jgi:hypothetical protein
MFNISTILLRKRAGEQPLGVLENIRLDVIYAQHINMITFDIWLKML